jgi:amphi-Trp domain-containing protein
VDSILLSTEVKTMVAIPGNPGKAKGSPSGIEFEQEFYLNRSEAAKFLRELAGRIETGGAVEMSRESWTLVCDPIEPFKLEVQYKAAKRELEVQLKLKELP